MHEYGLTGLPGVIISSVASKNPFENAIELSLIDGALPKSGFSRVMRGCYAGSAKALDSSSSLSRRSTCADLASHALKLFLKMNDLVVFNDAQQVSNWNQHIYFLLIKRLTDFS